MKTKLLAFITTLAFTSAISSGKLLAQTPTDSVFRFSLQQAIDYALQYNTSVVNAQLDEQINHRKVQEYLSAGLPQVSASGSLDDYIKLPITLVPGEFINKPGTEIPVQFGQQYNVTGGFSASQLVFDGQFFIGLQATRALVDLAQKTTQQTKTQMVEAVSKAYYTLLVTEKSLDLLTANISSVEKLLSDTKASYSEGFVEKLDVDRVTVTYNNLQFEQQNLQKLITLLNNVLKFQIGMDVRKNLQTTDTLHAEDLTGLLSQADRVDPENRIEYQILQTQSTLLNFDIKRYKFQYLPTLYAVGSYSWQGSTNEFNTFFQSSQPWYPTGLIGLNLKIPIFDGFQKARIIEEDKLQQKQLQNDISQLQNAIRLQTNDAKDSLEVSISNIQQQKKNMDLAQEVFSIAKAKYQQGVGNNTDVINAETDLKQAQTNYIQALYDATVSKISLEKALGILYR
jgi:outer membrane protein